MHEYVEQVVLSGVFDDPRLVYNLTIAEITAIMRGKNNREKELQRANNMRAGMVCSCVYNQHRQKETDKMWRWDDFFPDKSITDQTDQDKLMKKLLSIKQVINGELT